MSFGNFTCVAKFVGGTMRTQVIGRAMGRSGRYKRLEKSGNKALNVEQKL